MLQRIGATLVTNRGSVRNAIEYDAARIGISSILIVSSPAVERGARPAMTLKVADPWLMSGVNTLLKVTLAGNGGQFFS